MASLDHRLNPLFSIKECMTCGALYTADFCCSKGGLEDKILVPKPTQSCATCGNPVDGLYCRHCVFVRKCLNEGWYTIHDENEILNTSKSSKHNTNVVSAPQEPFVFNQDPGENSSQSPLQINHNCCYKCGDLLDGIFCQQCTCKSCGNVAHIGYNCPPKASIISNPEQCNQTINELPQTLPSVHPTYNHEDENSFTYDSKPNSFNNSPTGIIRFSYYDDDQMMSLLFIWTRPKAITFDDEHLKSPYDPIIMGERTWNSIPESQDIPITSPKIDFLSEEFTGEFAPIPPGMDKDEFEEEESCIVLIMIFQGGLTSIVIFDNSNDPLLELPEFESFHFDFDPSFPRPPPEPPDVEISLII
ncbi:hypothetical protein Tco_1420819 [Tanacetum coccineum]